MSEVLKKFGRYFLLDHIAQGGMAEIFRARFASVEGAGRIIVIKRIQTGYGANTDFLNMFKSEIKVTMSLNHSNIVQVYDFGEEQGQPYIAMEFVDGKSLRQCLARTAETRQFFPIELSAYIIGQIAQGLGYAHSFKDKLTGQSLNIVHRDISPQNILISYDGTVKIIDFGIAKVATRAAELTRAGVIKGKPSYLSPEQINGDTLDGRSDVFGLGIVFWELLTGKKLFAGENDLAVLKLIENCNTSVRSPSTLNPDVPKELDYIVLKVLAKQADKRYQTADELARTLTKYIFTKNSDFNSKELSYFIKGLFKNEIVEDRKNIQKLNEKAQKLLEIDFIQKESTVGLPKEVQAYKTKKEDTNVSSVEQSTKVTSLRNIEPLDAAKIVVEIENTSAFKTISGADRQSAIALDKKETRTHTATIPKQKYIRTEHKKSSFSKFIFGGLVIAAVVFSIFYSPEEILNQKFDFFLNKPKGEGVVSQNIVVPTTEPTREPANKI
ncbi:MAG: serine/threonine protein kinase [Bdellovibrio sp.]|nr:serine/threonine protein kinase [Bdellovibrio sp.]